MTGEDSDTKLREFISRFREYGASDAQIRLSLTNTKLDPAAVDRALGATPRFGAQPSASVQATEPVTAWKPFYTKWWFFVIIGVVVLGSVSAALVFTGVFEGISPGVLTLEGQEAEQDAETIARAAEAETETGAETTTAECESDTDSYDYGYDYCSDDKTCIECLSTDDCDALYGEGECASDGFCAFESADDGEETGDDAACDDDSCAPYVCETDTDCYEYCDYDYGDSGECYSGYTCSSDYECAEDADADGTADVDDTTECADEDCGGYLCYDTETCDDSCLDADGLSDDDLCYTGYVCSDDGACVECSADSDCESIYGDGYVCGDEGFCALGECELDLECEQSYGAGYVCSDDACEAQALSSSSECATDDDCVRLGETGTQCSLDGYCESSNGVTGSFITGFIMHSGSGSGSGAGARALRRRASSSGSGSSSSSSCSTTLQCRIRYGAGYVCSSGSCEQSSDSATGASGTKAIGARCSDDDECRSDTCTSNRCARSSGASTQTTCSSDCTPYGCNRVTGECRTTCTSDSQCDSRAGYTCDTSTGDCESASTTTATSCTRGTASDCSPFGCNVIAGTCRTTCTSDQHCYYTGGYTCDTGSGDCEAATTSCTVATASTCSPFKCNVLAGTCRTTCTTDRQCDTDGGYACDADTSSSTYHTCVAEEDAACTYDIDCWHTNGYGWLCDDESTCVERTISDDAECASAKDCRTLGYGGRYTCDENGACVQRGRSTSSSPRRTGRFFSVADISAQDVVRDIQSLRSFLLYVDYRS